LASSTSATTPLTTGAAYELPTPTLLHVPPGWATTWLLENSLSPPGALISSALPAVE
jgi:hypothetical protein